jgi:hypothetical protein
MLIGAVFLVALPACKVFGVSFDKEKWASGKVNRRGENPRGWMVSDAEKTDVKLGASRASIRALFGEPDNTGLRGDSWVLGRGGYAPDYEVLRIQYDENDIAIEVRVFQS